MSWLKSFAMIRLVLLTIMVLWLGACAQTPPPTMLTLGNYQLAISSDPSPMQVGKAAEIEIEVKDDKGEHALDCLLQFRQYMPGMEMTSDTVIHPLKAIGSSGRYQVRSGDFSMGGDWVFAIQMTCNGRTFQGDVNYHLEWPE